MAMRTEWVIRSRTQGYLLDTCAGGAFTGPEAFKWTDVQVVESVLTWPNVNAVFEAMRSADLERSEDLDAFPIDL